MRTPPLVADRRDVFIGRVPVEPRMAKAPSLPLGEPTPRPMAVATPAPAPAPVPEAPKAEGRLNLFARYRSLTAPRKPEPAPAPEIEAKERTGMAISMAPQDRGSVTSHDEDELEIPAFLRRQAN